MKFTVWHSSESFADWLIDHTDLRHHDCEKRRLPESDASKPRSFHAVPDHLKKVLYLDASDIVVELGSEPILTIEESKEAGTGHNAFQRFSRLAAAAENGIPSFYVYPEAVAISRKGGSGRPASVKWDVLNPLAFKALRRLEDIFGTPALLFFYPSRYPEAIEPGTAVANKGLKIFRGTAKYAACPEIDASMRDLFACVNRLLSSGISPSGKPSPDLGNWPEFRTRREWRDRLWHERSDGKSEDEMSPLSAVRMVPTSLVLDFIRRKTGVSHIDGILPSRAETAIYQIDASFRGDPYPGALSVIDYLKCRTGRTFEERWCNLVMAWGTLDVNETKIDLTGDQRAEDFCGDVRNLESRNLLTKTYDEIKRSREIPRYYMQARYGSMFSRSKHIRVYSYFCDAILFPDGALWREG